jgi:hypothetical protein
MLNRVDQLEQQLESYLTEFFQTIRGELSGLADRQDVEAAAASFRHAPADDRTEEFGPGPFEEPRFEPTPRPEGAQQQPEPPTVAEPEPAPEQEQEPQTMPPEGQNGEPRRRRGLLWGRRERGGEEPAPPIAGTEADDAHVMALNMALNGTPREETEDYLRQRFAGVKDLDSILDDVYGRVKGR